MRNFNTNEKKIMETTNLATNYTTQLNLKFGRSSTSPNRMMTNGSIMNGNLNRFYPGNEVNGNLNQ